MAERANPLAASVAASTRCEAAQLAALPPELRRVVRDAATLLAAGVAVPETCRAVTAGDHAVLWLGPDDLLVLGGQTVALNGGTVVEVSHRDAALSVAGPQAARVLNAFCALDLHPTAFPVGMCTRTLLGKAEIVLWRTAPDTFRIDVARSFAPYVWACLEEARREFL